MAVPSIEEFIRELKKKPVSATGYYPPNAGELDSSALESAAYQLDTDVRVKSVDQKFSGNSLKQLWVVLEDDEYEG